MTTDIMCPRSQTHRVYFALITVNILHIGHPLQLSLLIVSFNEQSKYVSLLMALHINVFPIKFGHIPVGTPIWRTRPVGTAPDPVHTCRTHNQCHSTYHHGNGQCPHRGSCLLMRHNLHSTARLA